LLLKKGKWNQKKLAKLRNSTISLEVASLIKMEKVGELQDEINQAISENQLDGLLSRSEDYYIPRGVIEKAIRTQTATGIVDKVPIIKSLDISGNMLDLIIEEVMGDIDGFWDTRRRKWFSSSSAKQILLNKISGLDKVYAWEIMSEFGWSVDRLEKILSLVAEEADIFGFIDRNHVIIISSNMSRDLILHNPRSIEIFSSFLVSFLAEKGEEGIPIKTVMQLFNLTHNQFNEVIDYLHTEGIFETLLSENGQRLLSQTRILERIVKYVLVLEPFPIETLAEKLSLSSEVLEDILQKLQAIVTAGYLQNDGMFIPSAESLKLRLLEPVDVNAFASVFAVSPTVSLRMMQMMANAHGLRLVNKGTEVVGINDLKIYCQLDGTVYEEEIFADEPRRYYECMNCRRVVCASCYESRDSKSCPFCDNISQFILEFPRYCSNCGLTYLGVEGLQSSEKCRLCEFSPLERGWMRPSTKQQTIVKEKILEELKSRTSDSIPLPELTTVLRFSDEIIEKEIIEMILDGTIHFRISLDERRLIRYEAKEEEKCMICETSKDLTLQCTHCNAKVCIKCSESLRLVNGYFCIECSGELQNTND